MKIRPILPIQYNISLKAKFPPFNQQFIRISPDEKSHSSVLNSVTAPILSKWKLVTSFFYIFSSDLFQYYSTVTTFLVWSVTLKPSATNFECAPQLWYMYRKCCEFRLPWIWTVIISECLYYDVVLCAILSSFPFYPQIYGQIFSPASPTFLTALLWRSSFTKNCIKPRIRNIFTHTAVYRVIREFWKLL